MQLIKLVLLSLAFVLVTACSGSDHSHDDGSHSQDTPTHDSI